MKVTAVVSELQNIMFYHLCKQLVRPLLCYKHVVFKYQISSKIRLCSAQKIHEYMGLSMNDPKVLKYLTNVRSEYYDLKRNDTLGREGRERLKEISQIVAEFECQIDVTDNLKILTEEMAKETNKELLSMMQEERDVFLASLQSHNEQLLKSIFSMPEANYCSTVFLEVTAGVGGQEAMLFAREIYDMYCGYCEYKGWNVETVNLDMAELGGLRHSSSIVTGDCVFNLLRFEAGVHRVQRIPSTEKAGRVHTSTVTVAVIPKPDDIDLNINEKDIKIETKRASGAGGQHVNTTDSAVRIVHLPTGVAVECQTERSQIKNKEIALKKLQAKLCKQHIDAETASSQATRKSQVGSSFRNEKIRTYNYNQDRISDHRIEGGTLHNLETFLLGGIALDELIHKLRLAHRKNEIIEMIKDTK